MKPILITLPYIIPGEARLISTLSRYDGGYIHLRKPDETRERIEQWLKELTDCGADLDRLTLHHYPELAVKYSLGGAHISYKTFVGMMDMFPPTPRMSVSCHSWDEVDQVIEDVDYVFISPVFDSVSKPGYRSNIELAAAYEKLKETDASKVVALGGINCGSIGATRDAGFGGAAMLGAAWKFEGSDLLDNEATINHYAEACKIWKLAACSLQFISHGDMDKAWEYLEGGGRWIQLRMKDADHDEITARGKKMAELCRRYDAVFIVNDDPGVAALTGADGVHLGKNDMAPDKAREMLGNGMIIGATANTIEDILVLNSIPVDYIGLGPFRFTPTKKNLSPILGFEGYRNIVSEMRRRNINIPVVAIGGIVSEDIDSVMDTGVTGVAVSAGIADVPDVQAESRIFIEKIRKTKINGNIKNRC